MNKLLPILIVALIAGGISFYGGTVFAKNRSANQKSGSQGTFFSGNGVRTMGGRGNSGGLVNGKIISKDATGMTIELNANPGQDGSAGSKIVFFSASTTVSKMAQGSMDDLAPGTNVTVIGSANTDGSVTAQSVQIRPEGGAVMRFGAPPQP